MYEKKWTLLIAVGGLAACAVALWLYLAPLTGVTGTAGAALAAFGGVAVLAAGLVLRLLAKGAMRTVFMVLTAIGIVGTGVAGYFLLSQAIPISMVVSAVGLAALLCSPKRRALS